LVEILMNLLKFVGKGRYLLYFKIMFFS